MAERSRPEQRPAEVVRPSSKAVGGVQAPLPGGVEALQLGIGEIKGYGKKIGVLLTDGDWTSGEDPLPVARRFDNLHVIGLEEPLRVEDVDDEITFRYFDSRGDMPRPGGWGVEETLRRYQGSRVETLAREGRGHFSYVQGIKEVPLAITRCLAA